MTFRRTNGIEAVPLSSVPLYVTSRISRLALKDQARRRLLHIGFTPGAQVTPVRRSPAGDPTAYFVRGATVALRREQADEIIVTLDLSPSPDSKSPDNSVNAPRPCYHSQVPANLVKPDCFDRLAHRARTRLTQAVPGIMRIRGKPSPEHTVALAGNPNTGKSALFNALTGLNQHTGNWPGKTVTVAEGFSMHKGLWFRLVDLPGTYSLLASSKEEEVARDFICFGAPDVTVVVTDATCLERNLDLVLEILEVTSRVVVALNLVDEACRKRISINILGLSSSLGVPVIPTVARLGRGLGELMDTVQGVADGRIETDPLQPGYDERIERVVSLIEPWIRNTIEQDSCILPARWIALRLLDGDPGLKEGLLERLRTAVSEGDISP